LKQEKLYDSNLYGNVNKCRRSPPNFFSVSLLFQTFAAKFKKKKK
jgi:hypothetical protein